MSNRYKTTSIIIIAFLLVGILIFFSNQTESSTQKDQQTNDTVPLLSSSEGIQKIHIYNKENDVVLSKAENGRWSGENLDKDPDKEKIDNAVNLILSLNGKQVDKKSDNVGLAAPLITIDLLDKSEEKKTLSIGEKSEDGLYYYVAISGDDLVYQIDAAVIEKIPLAKHDLTDNRITNITSESVNKITIDNGIQTIELLPESSYNEEEVRTNLSGWFMHQPYNGVYNVKYKKMTNMLYGIENLESEQVADENADNLEQYGLNEVDFTISLHSDSESDTILIGSPANGQTYYAMMKDENTVFTISKKTLEPYSYKAFDIVEKFVKILAIDVVKQLEIKDANNEILIDITHTEQENDSGEKETTSTFKINGQTINEKSFRNLYKVIAGLSAEKEVSDAKYQKPEATMNYTIMINTDEEKEILVEYVPYDEDNFAVFINGTADFLIEKQTFSKMVQEIKTVKEDA